MSAVFEDITATVGHTPLVQINKLNSGKAIILAKLELISLLILAGPEGFEPSLTRPKPGVLPLDDGPFKRTLTYRDFLL